MKDEFGYLLFVFPFLNRTDGGDEEDEFGFRYGLMLFSLYFCYSFSSLGFAMAFLSKICLDEGKLRGIKRC